MSGIATGWVGQHGPRMGDIDHNGVEYGGRARGLRFVLMGIADSANTEGKNSHPGVENLARFALYSAGQVRRLTDDLERDGWVTVTERGGGRGRATVFDVCMDYRDLTEEQLADRRDAVEETLASRAGSSSGNARMAVPETRAPVPETRAPATETRASGCATNGVATEPPTEEPSTALVETSPFDEFWQVFALDAAKGSRRKTAKPAAGKAFAAAVKRGNDPEVIIAGARRWSAYYADRAARDPGAVGYEPMATTFLNQDRWNDETLAGRRGGVASNLDAVREVQEAYEEHGVAPGDLFGFGQER